MTKYAIVTHGNGMGCVYSAGFLYSMFKNFPEFKPDILVGSSGSSATLAYILTSQIEEIKIIWTEKISSKKFISFFRFYNILSIDYLIDILMRKHFPLNTKEIVNSKQKIFISATNIRTGKVRYFSNNDDIYKSLKASKAIPILYGKKVLISNEKYIDGNFSSPLSKNIQKAINEGATNILIVSDEFKTSSSMVNLFLKFWLFFQNKVTKKTMRSYFSDKKLVKEIIFKNKKINFFFVSPSKKTIFPLNNSKKKLYEIFKLGETDFLNNKKLKKFISF